MRITMSLQTSGRALSLEPAGFDPLGVLPAQARRSPSNRNAT